ncbi:hypothetical protein NHX12_029475 [Muraenolepis orangiensis]|uniref:LIM zinc-binding domain-containing protein n=1 Tax=Muraenolepis orangiensis TaxID=630683 RepID=A0A9Q0IPT9_9TELE|nr:hypothetical protein NHX12_029475 [Muraenolepis orangiensis]
MDYRSNSVSSRTPTPPGRYSPHSPMDQDLPMPSRRSSSSSDFAMQQKFDKESEVYKMIQENKESQAALRFPGNLSPNPPKQSPPVGGVSKHHSCEKCGTSIVMRGHFWASGEMFCEKHARERYEGPGTVSPQH